MNNKRKADEITVNLINCSCCNKPSVIAVLKCQHQVCNDCCLSQLWQSANKNNVKTLKQLFLVCPIANCNNASIDTPSIILNYANNKNLAQLTKRKIADVVIKNHPHFRVFNCPTLGCAGHYVFQAGLILSCNECKQRICHTCGDVAHDNDDCFAWSTAAVAPCPCCRIMVSKNCQTPSLIKCERCNYSWFWCCDNYWQPSHGGIYISNNLIKMAIDNYLQLKTLVPTLAPEVYDKCKKDIIALINLPESTIFNKHFDLTIFTIDEISDLLLILSTSDDKLAKAREFYAHKLCLGQTALPDGAILVDTTKPFKQKDN